MLWTIFIIQRLGGIHQINHPGYEISPANTSDFTRSKSVYVYIHVKLVFTTLSIADRECSIKMTNG